MLFIQGGKTLGQPTDFQRQEIGGCAGLA